ncbi:MAG: hypothetical protein GX455_00965 [Phycisphaerae bacterium]|nr:hypothetical protein [Phycisphaerae bacterium]
MPNISDRRFCDECQLSSQTNTDNSGEIRDLIGMVSDVVCKPYSPYTRREQHFDLQKIESQ